MAVSKKNLEALVAKLNGKLNRPATAYQLGTDGQVVSCNQGHLMLDYAAFYGGYTLSEMQSNSGVRNFYRGNRLSAKEMHLYLTGLLIGLDLAKGE